MEITFSGDAAELRSLLGAALDQSSEEPQSAKTKKQAIVDDITADIKSGRLQPGWLLPPTSILVDRYDASLNTIRAAIALLKAADLVYFVPGLGVAVSAK